MKKSQKRAIATISLVFMLQLLFPQITKAETIIEDNIVNYGRSEANSMVFISNSSQLLLVDGGESAGMAQTSAAMLVEPAKIEAPEAKTETIETKDDIKAYVLGEAKKAGLNPRDVELIVKCESTWNPKAMHTNRNGSTDAGLWQINSIHKSLTLEQKLDYKEATKWALNKRLRDGNWSAWSCARRMGVI